MINYINDIAKVDKLDRYSAIINVLNENKISYKVEKLPHHQSLGNIIVEFNPSELKKIVLSAHYDNVCGTPGANDNASACAILLNLIITHKNTTEHLEFVFFDLEENEFVGSKYYVKQNKNKIYYSINLDMCGQGESIVLTKNFHIDTQFKELCKKYNAEIVKKIPLTDIDSFLDENIKAICIISSTNRDVEWYKNYDTMNYFSIIPDFLVTLHKPTDTVDKINFKQVNNIYLFVNELLAQLLFSLELYNEFQSLINEIDS